MSIFDGEDAHESMRPISKENSRGPLTRAVTCEPFSDNTDNDNDPQALIGKVHDAPLWLIAKITGGGTSRSDVHGTRLMSSGVVVIITVRRDPRAGA